VVIVVASRVANGARRLFADFRLGISPFCSRDCKARNDECWGARDDWCQHARRRGSGYGGGGAASGRRGVAHTCGAVGAVTSAVLAGVVGACSVPTRCFSDDARGSGAVMDNAVVGADAGGLGTLATRVVGVVVCLWRRRLCSRPSLTRSGIWSMLVIPFSLMGTAAAFFWAISSASPCASTTTGRPRGTLALTGKSPLSRHASMTSASVVATSIAAYTALRKESRRCVGVSWLCSFLKRWWYCERTDVS